jgi:hypothetical protein
VFLEEPDEASKSMLDSLKAMGCDWEKTQFNGGELYALDIPPEVDIHEVYEVLETGQSNGSWLFGEGYVGHPLNLDVPPVPS